MKRMVKNGDLIDVEPDGSITVAGKPIGGGGSSEREITLTMPYPSTEPSYNNKIYLDDETWNKLKNNYYETIKIYYNDGNPLGVFQLINFERTINRLNKYFCLAYTRSGTNSTTWYGSYNSAYIAAEINLTSDSKGKYLEVKESFTLSIPTFDQSKFDALYKLADKPTQDGAYVLKATVSNGAVTYSWVAQ